MENTAQHSHYDQPTDVWQEAEAMSARQRHDEWERTDPNMAALADFMSTSMKAEGEAFAVQWAPPGRL